VGGDGVMAKLGEVCTIVSGSTPKTSVTSYWDGNIKWITPAELNEDTFYIMDSVRHITEEGKEKTGLSYLPTGTVILSSRAPIGKTAIAGCEMCCNQGFKNLICSDAIYNEYLYFFLKSKTDYLNSLGRGATFKEISKSIVESIKIPLPEVNQQKEIAEKFKKLEQLISLRKQQLAKLDELVKARFVEMFGVVHNSVLYPYVPVKSFTSVVSGGTPNRNVSEFWNNGSIRWVKTTELQNNVICNTDEKITQAGLDNSSAKIIPPNTVLIAMYGQGKTRGMTGYTSIECATNQACACILPCEQFNQNYLWRYMILSYDKLRDMAKGGNQPNLNIGIIKNFPVLKPPIELQNDFAAFVERVDQQKQTVQQSLEKLELMKKALLQEYFG
jgi:type I restriction enzyme S subunit